MNSEEIENVEVENVDNSGTDMADVSETISDASAVEDTSGDQADAASVVVSADSVVTVSSGDSSGASGTATNLVVEQVDTTAIEQYLASIEERLERVEDFTMSAGEYIAYESTSFVGSDFQDYNVTDGLLLIIFVAVVVSAILNKWRY